ncbi:POU domain class 2-associating factor 1-like isoform X1 [Sinocyclocheilus rhinocerous]|uniref:POU domain class 2-associating factor 1-like isoform X1 n=2 Tax=Sinocyclocheilus rhinocerous TaxID=307959 RepID=UPI0007B80002|nr:PREDICTED: POU domain class 2-associating factor 1-like isoform X1 [Sinocyclocheilus rhinocerous]
MGKSLSESSASKPYQGVRVKDPVKELLRRKRGNAARTTPPTAVGTRAHLMVPNNALPSYTHAGSSSFVEVNQSCLNDSLVDVSGLCTGWIAQTTSTSALQPLSHWTPPDQHHDPAIPSHTDMYVQPICPSYTVVGPSPMLTLHTPFFTNLATMSTSSSALPQVEVPDSSFTYIPWAQPLSTISGSVVQAPSMPAALSAPQLFPVPLTLPVYSPELEPQQVETPPAPEGTLALEKLLEEDEGQKEPYICNSSLFSEDI